MKKLLSSSEAAYHLGLSLQGVHYRIKKGQLESVKKDGKTYVYVQTDQLKESNSESLKQTTTPSQVDELIKLKDEHITYLKKSIKFLKKQHDKEISRLERNQEKILNVFQSEVDLLKSAFNEMKNIYNLEHKRVDDLTKTKNESQQSRDFGKFMDIKEFYLFMKKHGKTNSQVKKLILQRVQNGDKRFVYNKYSKELLIYRSDFVDLI